jgi:hypothetical protein
VTIKRGLIITTVPAKMFYAASARQELTGGKTDATQRDD